jgi:hypothetical protein
MQPAASSASDTLQTINQRLKSLASPLNMYHMMLGLQHCHYVEALPGVVAAKHGWGAF